MALDSRPRPVRRPARRRVPLLTALALLVMAAGLWNSWPAAASVPAPRLHSAEARVAEAETADSAPVGSAAAQAEPQVEVPAVAAATVPVEPVAELPAAVPVTVALPVGGPRAPPVS